MKIEYFELIAKLVLKISRSAICDYEVTVNDVMQNACLSTKYS